MGSWWYLLYLVFPSGLYAAAHGLLVPESELFITPKTKPFTLDPLTRAAFDPYGPIREYFFWWRSLPTIGLDPHPDWSPVFYPFIPHFFSLQELAPSQGASVSIALIDNGTAHKDIYDAQKHLFLRGHPYLAHSCCSDQAFVVSTCGAPSWTDYKDLILYYTAPAYRAQVEKDFAYYTPQLIDADYLTRYIMTYGKDDLAQQGSLSNAGHQALQKCVSCFKTVPKVCQESSHDSIPLHLLALPDYLCSNRIIRYADQQWLYANHGTYCAGLIVGHSSTRTLGIAPHVKLASFKAVKSCSKTHYQEPLPLVQALVQVQLEKIPIVSISYSMRTSGGYHSVLENSFKDIPFSCVAVGNKNPDAALNYLTTLPITAAVGSFGIKHDAQRASYTYPISNFNSELESDATWYIVLPGESLLSCCYTPSAREARDFFVFMQGTSTSTPLLAGFFALLVGEFFPTLSYEQIKQLVKRATVRLHNTEVWRSHSGTGTLDMRMALFMGHVMVALKVLDKNFTKNYAVYLDEIRKHLLQQVNDYGEKRAVGIDFEKGMIDFLQKARQNSVPVLYTHKSFSTLVYDTAAAVMNAAQNKKGSYAHKKPCT